MAQIFREAGIPAAAITSDSPAEDRVRAASMLRNYEVNVLFTVDLFNEGVDIPEIDCVLFLRPTESSTVRADSSRIFKFRKTSQPTFRYFLLKTDFFPNQRGQRVLPTGVFDVRERQARTHLPDCFDTRQGFLAIPEIPPVPR